MIVDAIIAMLNAQASITALAQAVEQWPLTQGAARPSITVFGDDNYDRAFDGPVDVVRGEYDLSCWSTDAVECKDLAKAVAAAIDDYKGTHAGVRFQQIFLNSSNQLFEDDSELHRIALQFTIWHSEG